MSKDSFICPHCSKEIALSEALVHSFEEEALQRAERTMAVEREKWQAEMKKVEEQARVEAKKGVDEEYGKEIEYLNKKLKDKEERLEEFRREEMKLREERDKIEEERRELELMAKRTIENERKEMSEKLDSEYKLREAEMLKKMEGMRTALEEAQRKAQQGSQQTQGEVLELDLENTLRAGFVSDVIEEVAKGSRGADLKQTVRTSMGNSCGVIMWEFKRTKEWSDAWIRKLKDDLRAAKANVPVIVTVTLPREVKTGMGLVDGVWVCVPALVIPMAQHLRQRLIDVAKERFVGERRGEKSELLYNYVTSHEFVQKMEALAEIYQEMQGEINKERAAMERIWKSREMQTRRLMQTTAGMVGELRGLLGQSLPSIKNIEMIELPGEID